MSHTTDPNDPGLRVDRGDGQHVAYLVLSDEERAKGFVRPYRDTYVHSAAPDGRRCGAVTRMSRPISETYARNPSFYGATFCVRCGTHYPVAEFTWEADGQVVGS